MKEAPGSWDFNDQTKNLRYHIHELSLASGTVRALTQGDTDNFSPVHLALRAKSSSSPPGAAAYHRCGRGPCFVYTLARMEADGSNPHSISFHETHEWDPCLLNDGRVVYTRWDYVDRNAVHYRAALVGASRRQQRPHLLRQQHLESRPASGRRARFPGSSRIMATAAPHHGMSAGSVILLDTTQGVDGKEPLTRLTPEVRFPGIRIPAGLRPGPAA